MRNEGDGRFTDVSDAAGAALALSEASRGAAFGDIDNDGDGDVVVGNNNGPAHLLRNEVGAHRTWLRVRLVGVAANRDGIGALVGVLRAGGAPIWRRAHADGSYLSASDPRVLVGLGETSAIDGVVVRWPGGRDEVWRDIVPRSDVVLTEGTGKPWPPPGETK